jgi:hypothetical protein
MNIINLTPHAITLRTDAQEQTFPASGTVARVPQETTATGKTVAGFPVHTSSFGQVVMPEPIEGTVFIVSAMVLSALAGTRQDVVAPRTDATAIRNDAGHIIAVTGWLQ